MGISKPFELVPSPIAHKPPRLARTSLGIASLAMGFLSLSFAVAEDVSSPAMLQMFEARWNTIEDRMVDVFTAGYGGLWLPPPGRADTGGFSAGYDNFNRFDLGKPRSETLYGTDNYFRQLVKQSHLAKMRVHTDLILNHNGFRDNSTPGFIAEGSYPGFVLELPNDPDGDFHGRFEVGEEVFRLAGLIDIAQEKNYQFIRHPVDPNDPNNIPGGTLYNVPDPDNARFYPDQNLGGTTVFHPQLNQNVTLYNFNTADPLQGDAVQENATGLLMRSMRWMIQEMGVDGFRVDAARHMPRWVLDFVDQAVYLSKTEPLLDGSQDHPFLFSETGYDSPGFLQSFIRKDIDNSNLGQLGGNRDALDFNLFGAITNNLTSNGLANDWRNIKSASIDGNDDGFADNGSQGVAFPRSHDELGAYLDKVAHAYLLMRPGNALVYFNAEEFGSAEFRMFPRGGRDDALGGFHGDAIKTLVNIRNTHGRGNFADRTPTADQKELLIYERSKSALVGLNNRLDGGIDTRTVLTSFDPGTPLIELTGNANDPLIDPNDDIPAVIVVNPNQTVEISVPRNMNANSVEHGSGYVIYGVSGPQGNLQLQDTAGQTITNILPGGMPTDATNGTTRLSDITVVTEDLLNVRLETNAVTLPGGIRDRQADGDYAILSVDGGIDINGNGIVDHVTPNSVDYGFEEFTGQNDPGFFDPSGNGVYQQSINTSALSEGVHFITGRAFRHRDPGTFTDGDPSTAGDGGPAVFTDFREAIYVDRLPPESSVAGFEPFPDQPLESRRDLFGRSDDLTADAMHLFLNQPASRSDAQLIANALAGQNRADQIDRDLFVYGYNNVPSGNNVGTIVTFEITGNVSVTRVPGLFVQGERGLGIGDLNFDNVLSPADMRTNNNAFEDVIYSQNSKFNPAGDVNADGFVDNLDLYAMGDALMMAGADLATIDAWREVVFRRGDVNQDGNTNADDIDWLFANIGVADWFIDLDVDGVGDFDDVVILVESIFGTLFGDANLDGFVDGQDFIIWNQNKFTSGNGWAMGDFNGDGFTDGNDFIIWNGRKFQAGSGGLDDVTAVPEPHAVAMILAGLLTVAWGRGHFRGYP